MVDVILETDVNIVDAIDLHDGDIGLVIGLNLPQSDFLAALRPDTSLCFEAPSGDFIAVQNFSIGHVQPIEAKAMIGVKKSQAPFVAKGTRVRVQRASIA